MENVSCPNCQLEREFTLYYRHGKREVIRGTSISDALNSINNHSDVAIMDFYVEGVDTSYMFVNNQWELCGGRRRASKAT